MPDLHLQAQLEANQRISTGLTERLPQLILPANRHPTGTLQAADQRRRQAQPELLGHLHNGLAIAWRHRMF